MSDTPYNIRTEQLRTLFDQTRITLFGSVAVAIVVFFVLLDKTEFKWLVVWATFFSLVAAGRLILYSAYHRKKLVDSDLEKWYLGYLIGITLGGLTWGSAGLLLAVTPSILVQGFIIISVGGVLVGALSSHAVLIPAYLAFVLPAMLPLAIWQFWIGESPNIGFGLLILLFLSVLVLNARYYHRNFLTSLQMQQKNIQLVNRADAANRAKSKFLASVSHELRTPLNAIIGYNELVKEELEDKNITSSHQDLDRINRSAKYLLGLIDNLLDLSRIEAGKLVISPEEVAITDLVEDIIVVCQPLAELNGNNLNTIIADDVNTAVIDPMRVKQCLLNLVGNATKFTEYGNITVKVQRNCTNDNEMLEFIVMDTGIGIMDEHKQRLFQEFSQASIETVKQYGGTGLGLSITHKLSLLMGGYVSVESKPGVGSTFTLSIPLTPA